MQLGAQPEARGRLQDTSRLLDRVGRVLHEHVAELGESALCHLWERALDRGAQVPVPIVAVLRRHDVGTQERAHKGEGLGLVQLAVHLEQLELVVVGQTVAALALDGGDTQGRHLAQHG